MKTAGPVVAALVALALLVVVAEGAPAQLFQGRAALGTRSRHQLELGRVRRDRPGLDPDDGEPLDDLHRRDRSVGRAEGELRRR